MGFVLRIRRVTRGRVKIYAMSDSLGTDPLLFVSVGDEVPVVLVLVVLLTFVVVVVVIQRAHLGDWDLFESESVHYSLQHCWVLRRLVVQLFLLHGA